MALLPPLIDIPMLEGRLGRTLAGSELVQAAAFIDDASALIRIAAGISFIDAITGVVVLPAALVPIVVRVVDRALENPHGLESETTGNHSWRAPSEGSGVHLTRKDRNDIRSALGLNSGVRSVTLEGYLPLGGPDDILPISSLEDLE